MHKFGSKGWRSQMVVWGLPLVLLAGCAHHTGSGDSATSYAGKAAEAESAGMGEYDRFAGQNISPQAEQEMASSRVYYFPYDSDRITPEAMENIDLQARYLLANPNAKIRIEGHCDKRGSREYNIGLGERRAQAVAEVLASKGVARHQMAIVSYGKEQPAVQGDEEAAFKWNRRAKIVYEAYGPQGGNE